MADLPYPTVQQFQSFPWPDENKIRAANPFFQDRTPEDDHNQQSQQSQQSQNSEVQVRDYDLHFAGASDDQGQFQYPNETHASHLFPPDLHGHLPSYGGFGVHSQLFRDTTPFNYPETDLPNFGMSTPSHGVANGGSSRSGRWRDVQPTSLPYPKTSSSKVTCLEQANGKVCRDSSSTEHTGCLL